MLRRNPKPPFRKTPNGLELSGPAKTPSHYRAAVAGSGEWLGELQSTSCDS